MLDNNQLRNEIIKPCLDVICRWSKEAEELLVLTCAHESLGGTFIKQVGGEALGIYQMEPASHGDLWNIYMPKKMIELYKILSFMQVSYRPPAIFLKYNVAYATFMARMFYLRINEPLPKHDDVEGLANYYKKYWNTPSGKAKVSDVIDNYYNFINQRKEKKIEKNVKIQEPKKTPTKRAAKTKK